MYSRNLFIVSMIFRRIFIISCIRPPVGLIGEQFGFLRSSSFMGKTQSFRGHSYKILPEQLVSIADKLTNYELQPLLPISKGLSKNIYLPGETHSMDFITLLIYASELSTLLNGATLIGVTQISQERLHAIFLHFRDKWRGASRLLIFHPNKFYPPIYFGSKVGTLETVTNISPTYLEDTLNVLKNLVITEISCPAAEKPTLNIHLVDKMVTNARYKLEFCANERRNSFVVSDVTNEGSDGVVLFDSNEWIFPEKKKKSDREKMLKIRLTESKKLYNTDQNGSPDLQTARDLDVNAGNDATDETNAAYNASYNAVCDGTDEKKNIFRQNKSGNIPIAKLMSRCVANLSLGTAVDICRASAIPEEKLAKDLTNYQIQILMNKVEEWQNINIFEPNELLPHISHIDDIYYYNVTNFRKEDTGAVDTFTTTLEMIYHYYESNTIPCRHRDIANKAAKLCETQRNKLERMADTLSPIDSPERLALIEEKLQLLDKYKKTIGDCMSFTTMDSHQMLLEMVEDMQELTSSKCTSSRDRVKLKKSALEFDRELHMLLQKNNATQKVGDKPANVQNFGGLLTLKCLVDDPDSPLLIVGRNAKQNEKIVLEIGKPGDLWLHASHVPGAHVLLKRHKQLPNDVLKKVIQFAADVAAYFSKAKGGRKSYTSANISASPGDTPVDVTLAEFENVAKEEGMDMGAVLVRSGKIIKASPRRARKKVEEAIQMVKGKG